LAFRPDVSVNWAVSPRIITVAAPSAEITVQDLVDTLRTLEAEIGAIDDFSLLDATGKDILGVDKHVGITLKLLNARVAFEARPPPTYVQCIVTGGNIVAVDALGDPMKPVEPTAYTQVVIEQSTSPTLVYASGGSPEDIADAVWNELSVGHVDAGKAGAQLWTVMDAVGVKVAPLPADPASNTQVQTRASQTSVNDAQTTLDFLRRFFTNKKTWDDVNKRWDIYDDAGAVVLYHWKPRTKAGADVTMPADAFAASDKVA
jgi:hypothetical protein